MRDNVEIIIVGAPHCLFCKITEEDIKGKYKYSVYDMNKSTSKPVLIKYDLDVEYDFPTFLVLKDGKEIYRTQVPLSAERVTQVLG